MGRRMRSPLSVLAWAALPLVAITAATAALAAPSRDGASAVGHASVQIVRPLTVQSIADLRFGCLVASGAGTVAVDAATGRTVYAGGVRPVTGAACAGGSATFDVTGEGGRAYGVALAREAVARRADAADGTLPVTGLHMASANAPGGTESGRLDAQGRDRLRVGGTLQVPGDAPPGRYVAQIVVNLAYH